MAVTTPQLFDPQQPTGGTVNPVALPITGAPLTSVGTPPASGINPVAPAAMPVTQTPPPSGVNPVAPNTPPAGSTLPGAQPAAMPVSGHPTPTGYVSSQDAVSQGLVSAAQVPSGRSYWYNPANGGFALDQNPGATVEQRDPSQDQPDPNSPIGTVWGQNVKTASGWENLGNFEARNNAMAGIGGRVSGDPNQSDQLTGLNVGQIQGITGTPLRTFADDLNGMGTRAPDGSTARFNPLGSAPQDVPLGAPGNPNPVDAMPVGGQPAVTKQLADTFGAGTTPPTSRNTGSMVEQLIAQLTSQNSGKPGPTDMGPPLPGRPAQPNAAAVTASNGNAGGSSFDQLLTQIDPGNDLRSKQINPTASPEAARARELAAKALEDSMGGPNRQELAQRAFDLFNEQDQPGYEKDLQNIYRLAGATGGLGKGEVSQQLFDRFLNRQKVLAQKKEDLGITTAGQEISDRLDRLNAANTTGGQFSAQDLSGRNELRGERGYQSDQAQQGIDNRLREVLTGDQLKNSAANRSNATLSFLMDLANGGSDPVQALLESSQQTGAEGAASSAAAGAGFLSAAQKQELEDYIRQHYGGGSGTQVGDGSSQSGGA